MISSESRYPLFGIIFKLDHRTCSLGQDRQP